MASIVVEQFVELAAGKRKVGVNDFRTVKLSTEERYCLRCFAAQEHDVWEGVRQIHVIGCDLVEVPVVMRRCQGCGKESVK